MDQLASSKTRRLVDDQVVATATATGYPTFPTGPDANGVVKFAGDFLGARIVGARWTLTNLTTFTAADCTLETSEDGETWRTLKAFAQLTANGTLYLDLLDTDPHPQRFIRALIDMTGTPGTSTHRVDVFYDQVGPRGAYAPPGTPDFYE